MGRSGLRRVGHWRNQRWGWGQRNIWLFVAVDGRWWVYVRVGSGEHPRERWKRDYADEEIARRVVADMLDRATAAGDVFTYFEPG